MQRFFLMAVAALASVLVTAGAASAHPHVWVTMKSELVYAPDGTVTGVHHAWTFDDMFSAFAMQGIEAKKKGEFTREELAPLAEVNVDLAQGIRLSSLRQGRRQESRVQRAAGRLLSGFDIEGRGADLALHSAVEDARKAKDLNLEIFDREFFVDFSFEDKEPVEARRRACRLQARGRQAAGHGCRRSRSA